MGGATTATLSYGLSAVTLALFAWIFHRRAREVGRPGWAWLLHALWVYFALSVAYVVLSVVFLAPLFSVVGPNGDPVFRAPSNTIQLLLGLGSTAAFVGTAFALAPRLLRPPPVATDLRDRAEANFAAATPNPYPPEKVLGDAGGERSTSGFFVFNYNDMDTDYGLEAFTAIESALKGVRGNCLFCDGDVSPSVAIGQAKISALVVPEGPDSPLADLDRPPHGFGPYLAAMWTDVPKNFGRVNDGLKRLNVAGYVGYMTVDGTHDHLDFLQTMERRLSLPRSYVFQDGTLDPGTQKYRGWGTDNT